MRITFGGINTGLPPNLVDDLIKAEKIPIKNMEAKKAKVETRLKLVNYLGNMVNKVDGSLGDLASVTGFNDIELDSADPKIISGTANSTSPKGSWSLEVDQLAQRAAALTNGFPDKNKTQIGTGYFRFNTPKGEKSVYINSSNDTLQGAADAINNADIGVTASVVEDHTNPKDPFRLMITGNGVGGDKKVGYPTLYFLDGDRDIYIDKQRPAKNGIIKVDGFKFQTDSNSVSDVIPGVTLNLLQAAPGRTVNLTVKANAAKVSAKITTFVKSMNDVLGFIQSQNHLNRYTDTSKTLGGDFLLNEVQSQLTDLIERPQYGVGPINYLWQLGIHFTRGGTLKLNADKFKSALAKSPDAVKDFFAGNGVTTGFAPLLHQTVMNLTAMGYGPIEDKKQSLRDEITQMDQNIAQQQRLLAQKAQMLREKFARLEQTMGQLKQQGSSIASMAPATFKGPNLSGMSIQS